ncbi:MAG: hypothetical protein IKU36_11850 [Bacteroidales bacterium]|nr:hypothetical protein [Bacteroidales bacterium]
MSISRQNAGYSEGRSGSADHEVKNDGVISRIGQRERQAVLVYIHHAKHLRSNVIILQAAGAMIRKVKHNIAAAAVHLVKESVGVMKHQELNHKIIPF